MLIDRLIEFSYTGRYGLDGQGNRSGGQYLRHATILPRDSRDQHLRVLGFDSNVRRRKDDRKGPTWGEMIVRHLVMSRQ